MKNTIESKLIAGLLALGFTETKSLSRYRVFLPTEQSQQNFKTSATKLYVGTRGAFRGSRNGTIGESTEFSPVARAKVLSAAPVPQQSRLGKLDLFTNLL